MTRRFQRAHSLYLTVGSTAPFGTIAHWMALEKAFRLRDAGVPTTTWHET